MAMYHDLEKGSRLQVDLKTNHKLKITNGDQSQKVVVQLIYKRGNKYARLAIDAPPEVGVEVLPPDGVIVAGRGA